MFEKFREKRKQKKESKRDYYDKEELRIQQLLNTLDPDSEKYSEIQALLRNNNQIRGESRESKRSVSKEAKGNIIVKVLGLMGAGVGLGSIIWAEYKGMTFTGEKRTILDAISRGIGNVFVRR